MARVNTMQFANPPTTKMALIGLLSCGTCALLMACTGDLGPAGNPGPPGARGVPGVTGAEGGTGSDGRDGVEGPAGPSGEAGSNGLDSFVSTNATLVLDVTSVEIPADTLAAEVVFSLHDDLGRPHDILGATSTYPVSMGFILAMIDPVTGQYNAYTTAEASSDTMTTEQAATDSRGTLEPLGGGEYRYTFGTVVPADFDASATHTLVATAMIRLDDGSRPAVDAVVNFVPDGSSEPALRKVVEDDSCSACHGSTLAFHGGSKIGVDVCVVCHTPQTVDPDSENTMDFKVMIHKIHSGSALPSVRDGEPYLVVGYRGSVHDYSGVSYPLDPRDCGSCHTVGDTVTHVGASSRATCGSCHDRTYFEAGAAPAGWTSHSAGPQDNDASCDGCHGEGSFADVATAHLRPAFDPATPAIELSIVRVDNATPGGTPEIVFTATTDGTVRDLLAAPLARLNLLVASSNPEFEGAVDYEIQGSSPVGTLTADTDGFKYTLPEALAADASGTYRFALGGYVEVSGARVAVVNPTVDVAVTGDLSPRRAVVDAAKCDACHGKLSMHGARTANIDECVMCHSPSATDDTMPAPEAGSTATVPTLDFKVMVHRIHMGEGLTAGYTLYDYQGNPVSFSDVAFPREASDCEACHLAGTYELPLDPAVAPSTTVSIDSTGQVVDTFVTPPAAAACTGCHDSSAAVAHVQLETTSDGLEACATCHGPSREFSVAAAHAGN